MRVVLFMVGLLALTSGGLKLRDRVRSRVGSSPLALAELATGALAVVIAGLGVLGAGGMAALTALALAALIAASVHQSRLVAEHRRSRERSEARRLQTFLETQQNATSASERVSIQELEKKHDRST